MIIFCYITSYKHSPSVVVFSVAWRGVGTKLGVTVFDVGKGGLDVAITNDALEEGRRVVALVEDEGEKTTLAVVILKTGEYEGGRNLETTKVVGEKRLDVAILNEDEGRGNVERIVVVGKKPRLGVAILGAGVETRMLDVAMSPGELTMFDDAIAEVIAKGT